MWKRCCMTCILSDNIWKESNNYYLSYLIASITFQLKLLPWVRSGGLVSYFNQGNQYRIGGCTGLASGTIYFGYRLILVYRFKFTAIFYIFIYICMYVCMYVYVCVCVCVIINIKVYHKTFPQFRTNYS